MENILKYIGFSILYPWSSNENTENLILCMCSVAWYTRLFVILWTADCQAPQSMGFSRQEYWSDSSRGSSQTGIRPPCPALQVDSLPAELTGKPIPRQHIKKQRHYFADKVCILKDMIFPVVMYGCESWTIRKTECWRIDTFKLWSWRRESLGQQGDPISQS